MRLLVHSPDGTTQVSHTATGRDSAHTLTFSTLYSHQTDQRPTLILTLLLPVWPLLRCFIRLQLLDTSDAQQMEAAQRSLGPRP